MRIALILFGPSDSDVMVYKDAGMFLYSLAKYCNWHCTYAYFKTQEGEFRNSSFSEYVQSVCIGSADAYREQVPLAKQFIKAHGMDYDVIMFFNYGSTIWRLARLCKQVNPHVVVYSKLDMGLGGFSHFHKQGILSNLKNRFERIKSQYVDFFTVETKAFYEALKENVVFRNRIGYLPNGVSLLDVDLDIENRYQKKENIILTVGRLGTYQKHNELLVDAIQYIPLQVLADWKIYFVGPSTEEFEAYVNTFKSHHPEYADAIVMIGNVSDRTQLYELYRRAKIMCMTSRYESFCIAAFEGIYFGTYPVLTNYSASVIDVTAGHRIGSIVNEEDAEALANELANELCKAMIDSKLELKGEELQCYAREHFSYEALARQLDSYLKRLIERDI